MKTPLIFKRLWAALISIVALALCILASTRSRADGFSDLSSGGTARVTTVIDGATLRLDDGRDLRLLEIEPPPPLQGGYNSHTLSDRATAALTGLARGQTIEIAFAGPQLDRYGRLWAQVRRSDGLWLQNAMLRRGLARVVPIPAIHAMLLDMLAAEEEARQNRRGRWATFAFAVRNPGALHAGLGDFVIVEGRVVAAIDHASLLSLSLAGLSDPLDTMDERIEVVLSRSVQAEFAAVGLAPSLATGWRVRARGWLERRNGVPQLLLAQREQLEFIAEDGRRH